MLKIYLVSILPVQPLSFNFSTSAFQFQPSLSSVSALQRLPFLFLLFQRFSSFNSAALFFFFPAKTCCPIQPQRVQLFSPKHFQLFMPTSKAQKKSSFSSVHPRPNIFCSCFMSLLFK